jgi:hypothetical protein
LQNIWLSCSDIEPESSIFLWISDEEKKALFLTPAACAGEAHLVEGLAEPLHLLSKIHVLVASWTDPRHPEGL